MQDSEKKSAHRRSVAAKLFAIFHIRNYLVVIRMFLQCDRPIDFLRRYVFRSGGAYPDTFHIRTPVGRVPVTAFTPEDILTINEIFFRHDYGADRKNLVVDFGSNIGISALFFLTRSEAAFVHCYEPLAQNIERLRQNLAGFEARYRLNEVAVSGEDGTVKFGWEPSGRYGGIGSSVGETIEVPAVDSNRVLAEIIREQGPIDLLKIDIEMLEEFITARIPTDIATQIAEMRIELHFDTNPHPATHAMSWLVPITTLKRR